MERDPLTSLMAYAISTTPWITLDSGVHLSHSNQIVPPLWERQAKLTTHVWVQSVQSGRSFDEAEAQALEACEDPDTDLRPALGRGAEIIASQFAALRRACTPEGGPISIVYLRRRSGLHPDAHRLLGSTPVGSLGFQHTTCPRNVAKTIEALSIWAVTSDTLLDDDALEALVHLQPEGWYEAKNIEAALLVTR